MKLSESNSNSSSNSLNVIQENLPEKNIILKSTSVLSSYSINFVKDLIKESSTQTEVLTINKQTSTPKICKSDKQIHTFKIYHQLSRNTQTKWRKIRIASRKTQTLKYTVADVHEILVKSFPNSPLLKLNFDQFYRLVTGNSRIPYSRESILQGYKIQATSGTAGYNVLRSEVPKCFPSPSIIRNSLSNFSISPGPFQNVIELLCNKLRNLPKYNQKIILSFDECSIASKVEFSSQHNEFIGLPTLEPEIENAPTKNCLIIIATCLTLPIRIPVNVDFTASSTKPGIIIMF